MKCCIEFDTSDQASYIPQVESLLQDMGLATQRVSCHDIIHGALNDANMVTFPGGLGAGEGLRQYGENFAKAMQFFVASGGGYLGICGGAYSAGVAVPALFGLLAKQSLRLIDTNAEAPPLVQFLSQYLTMQEERLLSSCDISAISHQITVGHEGERVQLVYSGGPILTFPGSSVMPLAYYYNDVLSDVRGEVAIAVSQFGKGHVVISGPHPEAPLNVGQNTGEPCCRWLYEAMVNYCLQPADTSFFPTEIQPWKTEKPLFSPALPMALVGGLVVGGILTTRKKCG